MNNLLKHPAADEVVGRVKEWNRRFPPASTVRLRVQDPIAPGVVTSRTTTNAYVGACGLPVVWVERLGPVVLEDLEPTR
jgi:hypothetical protein